MKASIATITRMELYDGLILASVRREMKRQIVGWEL